MFLTVTKAIAPSLSSQIFVGVYWQTPNSASNFRAYNTSHAHEQYAISSASHVDVATMDDRLDFQLKTALLTNKEYAIVLLRLA